MTGGDPTGEPAPPIAPPPPQPPPSASGMSSRAAMEAAWQRFVPVLWVMGLLVGSSLAGFVWSRVTKDESPFVDALITGFDAVVIVAFVAHEWSAVGRALRVRGLGWRAWALAALGLGAIGVVVEAWFYAGKWFFEVLVVLEPFRTHGWPAWSAVVLVVVCPAVFEELAFRGFVLERLEPLIGRRDALLLQATLFAILHLSPVILPSHFWMGLVLGALRVRTGSLVPGMCVHGAWNLYALIGEGLLDGWP
ncbi:MAG TPA: type II CAAX endopeptidase family protein [Planctomycetota bacterium]|nr:type II CAAX endopeptidase family protein [Planctomycetota bacterium]